MCACLSVQQELDPVSLEDQLRLTVSDSSEAPGQSSLLTGFIHTLRGALIHRNARELLRLRPLPALSETHPPPQPTILHV